jgi:hypothetical protein
MSKHQSAKDVAAAAIGWNGGQRITLNTGDTATCTALQQGQLYAIFFYNSAGNDTDTVVNVVWSNSQPPFPVTVPGTTGDQGLASLFLVSGSDTQTVAVSIPATSANAGIDCWLGSVGMPTDTSELINGPLPANGQAQPFNKYMRYYTVPPSSWQQVTINSAINQFISVQFQEAFATVNIVNPSTHPDKNIFSVGSVTKGSSGSYIVQTPTGTPQSLSYDIQGDGTQYVWMNADSLQDSASASITLQSLASKK